MQIGLCISGQSRAYKEAIISIRDNIAYNLNCDTYMYICDDVSSEGLIEFLDKEWTINRITILAKDKYIDDIDLSCCVRQFSSKDTFVHQKYLQQLYGNYMSYKMLVDSNKKYDIIFRVRVDTFVKEKFSLNNIEENTIYTVTNDSHAGINDGFAFGCVDVMEYYFNTINFSYNLPKDFKDKSYHNAENFLENIILYKDIKIKRLDMSIDRIGRDECLKYNRLPDNDLSRWL